MECSKSVVRSPKSWSKRERMDPRKKPKKTKDLTVGAVSLHSPITSFNTPRHIKQTWAKKGGGGGGWGGTIRRDQSRPHFVRGNPIEKFRHKCAKRVIPRLGGRLTGSQRDKTIEKGSGHFKEKKTKKNNLPIERCQKEYKSVRGHHRTRIPEERKNEAPKKRGR